MSDLSEVKFAMRRALVEHGALTLDGWTSQQGKDAAQELADAKLATITYHEGDQYGCYIVKPTTKLLRQMK